MAAKPPRAPTPRKKFSYDDFPERPALEPPAPCSEYAQNKIPASYMWSKLTHPTIITTRQGKMTDVAVIGKAAGRLFFGSSSIFSSYKTKPNKSQLTHFIVF